MGWPPYRGEKLAVRQHGSGVAREQGQEVELPAGQADLLAVAGDTVAERSISQRPARIAVGAA